MGYTGQRPSAVPLTTADLIDGSVTSDDIADLDAAKLTGTVNNARISLDAAEIPNLDTAKVTSGTFADARISEASVTQHVPAVDLTAVRQDIAMLALYNAVSDNRAAYNLPFSFIDQFEDETGLTTQTDCGRSGDDFMATVYLGSVVDAVAAKWTHSQAGNPTFSANTITWTGGDKFIYLNESFSGDFEVQFTTGDTTPPTGVSYICTGFSLVSNEPSVLSNAAFINWYGTNSWWYRDNPEPHYGSTELRSSVNVSKGDRIKFTRVSGVFKVFYDTGSGFVLDWTWTQENSNAVRFGINPGGGGTGWVNEDITYSGTGITGDSIASATGTLISDTQTSSVATTKMSGVILYKDNAGTATLGTDLKIYLSANGGTNYTEVAAEDFGAVTPLFSTGVKMVRLAEQTVTSGTAPVIKAVWANQAASSKETQLHGWAMNY